MNGGLRDRREDFRLSGGSDDLRVRSHDAMMHIASLERKCLLHQRGGYVGGMEEMKDRLQRARASAGHASAKAAAEAMNIPVATYIQHENGVRGFRADRAKRYARFFRVSPEWLLYGTGAGPTSGKTAASSGAAPPEADDVVEIQSIDLAFGLGSSFTDSPVEIDTMRFPRAWIEGITRSAPAHLTWTRGRGDSMEPTIGDGDLVLLDRSQQRVMEQDAIWAFTVGDTASIKRLRVKGDRFQIISDNPAVPPDEEPIDFVNIVARVAFVGKRK